MRVLPLALFVACHGGDDGDDGASTASSTADTGPSDTGTEDLWSEETFQAPATKQEDILFVIDNSCSMADNQVEMGIGMWGFVDTLNAAGIDWHAGVTSTDVDATYGDPLAGRLVEIDGVRWSSPELPEERQASFLQLATSLGTGGSGSEKGVAATYQAVELLRDADNKGFRRDDAGLHVIILSDEQDQSDDMRPELIPLFDFVGWLGALRAPNRAVSFSSIVCIENAGLQGGCLQFDVGTRYMTVSREIGGVVWNINDGIETGVTAVASTILAQAGFRTLELAAVPPDPSTLDVTVDGVVLAGTQWSYDSDSNSVVLTAAAPDGAEIVVRWPNL